MKSITALSAVLALSLATASSIASVPGLTGAPQGNQHTMTKADFERLMTELSNWGRWGKEDELGAINLIHTPETQGGRPAGQRRGLCLTGP